MAAPEQALYQFFGRRRIFIAGFTLFSLLGSLAQTGGELIAARAAQGIGDAILAPATLSLLTATFTDHHDRRRALGVWSATTASGAAGGLLLGGVLSDLLGWRWVLSVNVPIGAALIVGALMSLTESTGQLRSRGLDVAGAATLTAGMAILVYGIVSTDTHPWASARTIVTLAAGAAVLVLFVLIEARFAQSPIVPLRTLRRRSPLRAGLAFLPIGLATFAGALMAGRLVHRLGIRRQLIIAPLVTAAAVFWLKPPQRRDELLRLAVCAAPVRRRQHRRHLRPDDLGRNDGRSARRGRSSIQPAEHK
jgi:MFS family permease